MAMLRGTRSNGRGHSKLEGLEAMLCDVVNLHFSWNKKERM
jgi:hypothetical protein